MITLNNYKKRRQLFFSFMKNNSLALIFSSMEVKRSNDIAYQFHQESNFWYFTGFNEPKSLLIFIKKDMNNTTSIIFNQSHNATSKLWNGDCLGQENAIHVLGVDYSFSWNDLKTKLYLFINDFDVIYHATGLSKQADYYFYSVLKKLKKEKNNNNQASKTILDWRYFVNKMRLLKTIEEINILRKAAKISSLAHIRAMKFCKPNLYEYMLEAEIHHEFNIHGARFPAYNTIIASGSNALVLHYNNNNCKLINGDLVLIDAGCQYHGYTCDITRTFPINGKFNQYQLLIYNIVLKSLYKALSICSSGIYIKNVKEEVIYIIVTELVKLGILQGTINDLIINKIYKKFYMHNLIHYVGLDVHDLIVNNDDMLQAGMVIAIEPGIYIPFDNGIPKEYQGIGIRIEDTIVIKNSGNENLTQNVIKDPHEIEFFMLQGK